MNIVKSTLCGKNKNAPKLDWHGNSSEIQFLNTAFLVYEAFKSKLCWERQYLTEACWMDAQFEVLKNLSISKVRSFESYTIIIVHFD